MTATQLAEGSRRRRLLVPAVWIAATALLMSLPQLGLSPARVRDVVLICLMALTVSGLNLVLGYVGELNLGQTAMYAGGAYVTGYLAKNVVNDLALALVASVALGVVLGILVGSPGIRMGGWSLAIVSILLVTLIGPVINLVGEPVGGFSGMVGIPAPALAGIELTTEEFFGAVILVTSLWFGFFRNLVKSRYGNALLVLKESPALASSLGISPHRTKLLVYAVAAVPPAMAGCFFAYLDGYLSPDSFHLDLTITFLVASILGGTVSVSGAVVGSIVLVLGPGENPAFEQYSLVIYGAFLLLGGLFINDGIVGLLTRLRRRLSRGGGEHLAGIEESASAASPEFSLGVVSGAELRLQDVSKAFGGVEVLREVTLVARPGEVRALIGPNGSGKTTILNIISGFHAPDTGDVRVGATRISGRPVHEVARAGVGRTFQTPLLAPTMSARDAVGIANFDRTRTSFLAAALRLPSYRRATTADRSAEAVLSAIGLGHVGATPASALPLGTRRMVELARAVVRGESVLLLDEVAAGLDEQELESLGRVIRALRDAGATVLLVEHNFSFVRAVSDQVTVLVEGQVLVEGTPEQIMNDPRVQGSYLGAGGELVGTRVKASDDSQE